MLVADLLGSRNLAVLQSCRAAETLLRLPGGNANVLDAIDLVGEDGLNLFQRLASRLGEHKEDVEEHGRAEDGEDKVRLPLDVDKRGGNEVGESKVEDPVGGGGEGDGLATDAEREQLRRVDPKSLSVPRSIGTWQCLNLP